MKAESSTFGTWSAVEKREMKRCDRQNSTSAFWFTARNAPWSQNFRLEEGGQPQSLQPSIKTGGGYAVHQPLGRFLVSLISRIAQRLPVHTLFMCCHTQTIMKRVAIYGCGLTMPKTTIYTPIWLFQLKNGTLVSPWASHSLAVLGSDVIL